MYIKYVHDPKLSALLLLQNPDWAEEPPILRNKTDYNKTTTEFTQIKALTGQQTVEAPHNKKRELGRNPFHKETNNQPGKRENKNEAVEIGKPINYHNPGTKKGFEMRHTGINPAPCLGRRCSTFIAFGA